MAIKVTPEVEELLASMNQQIRDQLSQSVELGKWPDGRKLTEQQKENSLQAVILWDSVNGQETDEPFKVMKGGKLIKQAVKKKTIADDDTIIIKQ